ncbi:MAG: Hpt domain-containing protein, partial [Planctomycetes bacterium]|nr:Hpt domain-containing protein [Planctomycetota bacterium]
MVLDELAAAVVAVDPGDLRELARIHDGFQRIQEDPGAHPEARAIAEDAANTIEKIILQETDDVGKSLRSIGEAVERLQNLIEGRNPAGGFDPEGSPGAAAGDAPAPEASPSDAPAPAAAPAPDATKTAGAESASAKPLSIVFRGDPQLLMEFVEEAQEHIDRAESALLFLETHAGDAEAVNTVFRAFHTIKGTSSILGLGAVERLAHQAETLLDRVRNGEIRLAGGYADLALESADTLKQLIGKLSGDPSETPDDPANLSSLLERLKDPGKAGISEDAQEEAPVVPR